MRNLLKYSLLSALLWTALVAASSCKKTSVLHSGGQVNFSIDTLLFDTVFTAQGSSTRSLKIYNPQKEKIIVDRIYLSAGAESAFRLNINGYAGTSVEDIEIAGKDSIWVFAAVTIDPTDENNPFVVEDKLMVSLNGQEFSIPVLAFGQNAVYIVDSVLETQTWTNEKPYIILHNALVRENATLTIPAGVRVYMHQDSRLFVQGTLKINGTKTDSVIFQGDRIDRNVYVGDYLDIPGEWGGLYFFKESHSNEINYAVFKNGGAVTSIQGNAVMGAMIQLDPDTIQNGLPKLKLTNSVIHTSQGYGILAFNSSLYAENCLIVECGAENVMAFEGGHYQIYDCTIGTYGGRFVSHSNHVSLGLLNYFPISEHEYTSAPLDADVRNCIVYGSLEDEVVILRKDDYPAQVQIHNSLLKLSAGLPAFVNAQSNIFNEDPLFIDREKLDYHVGAGSPAIGNGIVAGTLNTDLDGLPRAAPPTMGCYEFF